MRGLESSLFEAETLKEKYRLEKKKLKQEKKELLQTVESLSYELSQFKYSNMTPRSRVKSIEDMSSPENIEKLSSRRRNNSDTICKKY